MLDLVFQNLTSSKKYNSKFFEKVLNTALKLMRSDLISLSRIEVSVNLVGEAKITELNKKYRKKNEVTNVLSFPMIDKAFRKPHTTCLPDRQAYCILHTTDIGDIFICLSFAKKEAKSENISIEKKLAQLTVHGFLHLIGYDHERSSSEAKKMFKLENKILSNLKI